MSEFDGWYKNWGIQHGSDAKKNSEQAWNHQQKKIDELQAKVNAMSECMDDAIRLIDEGNSWDAKELLK